MACHLACHSLLLSEPALAHCPRTATAAIHIANTTGARSDKGAVSRLAVRPSAKFLSSLRLLLPAAARAACAWGADSCHGRVQLWSAPVRGKYTLRWRVCDAWGLWHSAGGLLVGGERLGRWWLLSRADKAGITHKFLAFVSRAGRLPGKACTSRARCSMLCCAADVGGAPCVGGPHSAPGGYLGPCWSSTVCCFLTWVVCLCLYMLACSTRHAVPDLGGLFVHAHAGMLDLWSVQARCACYTAILFTPAL